MTTPAKPSIKASRLLAVLSHHIGQEKGISAKELAAFLGCSTRDVRSWITELRAGGEAVLGTPSAGYFVAASKEEIDLTVAFLRARAKTSLFLAQRLRKIAREKYTGQLRLET